MCAAINNLQSIPKQIDQVCFKYIKEESIKGEDSTLVVL